MLAWPGRSVGVVLARDCVASLKRWAQRDVYAISVWGQVDEVSAPSDKVIQFRL